MVSAPSDAGVDQAIRRVLMLGFMASGKSTVGAHLARRLGWTFLDFDEAVEARVGKSVAEIFRLRGEEAFRALEAEVGADALRRERVVLSAGGGWPARPGRMEGLPPGTLTVWLKVDAATALTRAAGQPGARPLLTPEGPGLRDRVEALLRQREPFYMQARLHLDSAGASPDALVDAILKTMKDPTRLLAP